MAYNEEANIGNLLKELLKQKLGFVNEIVVVNDGSTDKTAEIVKQFTKNSKIHLINLKKRGGKVNAINHFLKTTKSEVLILESADTLPHKNAVRELFNEFKDQKTGIAGAQIVPINKGKGFANFFGTFIYKLHHRIALEHPKFGELIAFRNIIKKVPKSAVDEECLAMLIKKEDYKLVYCPAAIVYNKQPTSVKELIIQRRRIHAGHLSLKKKGYKASTLNIRNILKVILKEIDVKKPHYVFFSIALEIYTRILGFIDYKNKKDHYIWDVVKSTKSLEELKISKYLNSK